MDWKRLFKSIGITSLGTIFISGMIFGFKYLVEHHLTFIFEIIIVFVIFVFFVLWIYMFLVPPTDKK